MKVAKDLELRFILEKFMLTKYSAAIALSFVTFFIACTNSNSPISPLQANSQYALAVFKAGKYANGAAATWADGDFDGDGKVTSADLKILTAALYPNRIGDCDGDGIISYEDLGKLTTNSHANKQPATRADCDFAGPNGRPDGVVNDLDVAEVMTSGLLPSNADLNRDGKVDYLDVLQLYAAGKLNTGKSASAAEGDVNGDGIVDASDLAEFSSVK